MSLCLCVIGSRERLVHFGLRVRNTRGDICACEYCQMNAEWQVQHCAFFFCCEFLCFNASSYHAEECSIQIFARRMRRSLAAFCIHFLRSAVFGCWILVHIFQSAQCWVFSSSCLVHSFSTIHDLFSSFFHFSASHPFHSFHPFSPFSPFSPFHPLHLIRIRTGVPRLGDGQALPGGGGRGRQKVEGGTADGGGHFYRAGGGGGARDPAGTVYTLR
jgi:hypothetical protein